MAGMLRDTIQREGLGDRVTMLGAVPTHAVRDVLVSSRNFGSVLILELLLQETNVVRHVTIVRTVPTHAVRDVLVPRLAAEDSICKAQLSCAVVPVTPGGLLQFITLHAID